MLVDRMLTFDNRLQASEKALKRELATRQHEAEEREFELLKRIKELEDEKALGATPKPYSPHPLPPYASSHDDMDEREHLNVPFP